MKGIVDRIEANYYVIELNGVNQDVPCLKVARDVKEGDIVELINGIWVTNLALTKERKESIQKLMDDVWED